MVSPEDLTKAFRLERIMRNLVVCFVALVLASCAWSKTKDNYIAHGVPVQCYHIPNPEESEAADEDKWWAPDLSRDEFLHCYELQQRTDLKLYAIKKEAMSELQASIQRAQEGIRQNKQYWARQQQMHNDYMRHQRQTLCRMYGDC